MASNRFIVTHKLSSDLINSSCFVSSFVTDSSQVHDYWVTSLLFDHRLPPTWSLFPTVCFVCYWFSHFMMLQIWSHVDVNVTQKRLNRVLESPPFSSPLLLTFIWKQHRLCVFVTGICNLGPSRPPHVWNVLATGFVIAWGVWDADHRVLLPKSYNWRDQIGNSY